MAAKAPVLLLFVSWLRQKISLTLGLKTERKSCLIWPCFARNNSLHLYTQTEDLGEDEAGSAGDDRNCPVQEPGATLCDFLMIPYINIIECVSLSKYA